MVPPPLRLQHLARTDSTNRVAMDAARAGVPGGLVVVADVQDAGRGRQGRRWLGDPHRSLLVSFLLRPATPIHQAWAHTLVAGLAALGVAHRSGAETAWLKWPNDVLVKDRKAGGVLCELSTQGGAVSAVVLGIGLNLSVPKGGWPEEIGHLAAALGSGDEGPSRGEALTALCGQVQRWERVLATQGPAPLVAAARDAMAPMIGRDVTAQVRGRAMTARVLGMGQNGALRVRTEDGEEHALLAGDVHLGT